MAKRNIYNQDKKNTVIPKTERRTEVYKASSLRKGLVTVYINRTDCLLLNGVIYEGKGFLKPNGRYLIRRKGEILPLKPCAETINPSPSVIESNRFISKHTKTNLLNTSRFVNNKKNDRIENIIKNKKLPNISISNRSDRNFKKRGR